MKLLWKLLRQHVSWGQFAGFFIANLVGLTIILTGIQFSKDIRPVFMEGDSFMKEDYLVISKKVNALRSLAGTSNQFTRMEFQELSQQPFVRDIGEFIPARFRVTGGLEVQGTDLYFSTYMFFESVQDKFIDIPLTEWDFSPEAAEIPIIIPRTYLNLYNFGFAESRSMPKMSEGMLQMLRLDIKLKGNGKVGDFKGKIVGFSNRLNTILVPETFMEWANKEYGGEESAEASRLIIRTDNPTDDRIFDYLNAHGYETEGEKLNGSRLNRFMRLIVMIVLGVGVLICLLSFFILVLSIYLLLQKNAGKLRNLILLGYPDWKVSLFYQLLALMLNFIACSAALGIALWLRGNYMAFIRELMPQSGEQPASGLWLWCVLLFAGMTLVDICIIRMKVAKLRD